MVHPFSPIGQTGHQVLYSFEALKCAEFHHGHGDCSMSFVGNFGEMVRGCPTLGMQGFVFRGAQKSSSIDPVITDRQVIGQHQLVNNYCRNHVWFSFRGIGFTGLV